MKQLSKLADSLLLLLFPPRCELCGEVVPIGGSGECCKQEKAALSLGDRGVKSGMPDKNLSRLDEVVSCYRYDGAASEAVVKYKFRGNSAAASDIARRMAEELKRRMDISSIDFTVHVPSYDNNDKHSRLLAGRVARELGIDFKSPILVKMRETAKQHELSRAERQTNIQNAFLTMNNKQIKGKRILICDDVVTSGSTLDDCARALRDAGAAAVYAVTFTSTQLDD